MTVLSLDTQQLFKTGGRQIRVKTKTKFLLKKKTERKKKLCAMVQQLYVGLWVHVI